MKEIKALEDTLNSLSNNKSQKLAMKVKAEQRANLSFHLNNNNDANINNISSISDDVIMQDDANDNFIIKNSIKSSKIKSDNISIISNVSNNNIPLKCSNDSIVNDYKRLIDNKIIEDNKRLKIDQDRLKLEQDRLEFEMQKYKDQMNYQNENQKLILELLKSKNDKNKDV